MRPLYDPLIHIKPLSIPGYPNLEHWSSFPSDSATYFVALAIGFWFLWRPLGAGLLLWAIGYVCIPRVILGLHYPSDIAVGALIGILTVALTQHTAIRSRIAAPALALERKRPDLFYPLMFLVSYELVVVFADIRVLFHAIRSALHRLGLSLTSEGVFMLAVAMALLAAAAFALAIRMGHGVWATRAPSMFLPSSPYRSPHLLGRVRTLVAGRRNLPSALSADMRISASEASPAAATPARSLPSR